MIRKTITFEDFDGNEQTEEHYFHFSIAEILDMESDPEGSLSDKLIDVTQSGDASKIIPAFRMFVTKGYGVREGGGFRKDPKLAEQFITSPAFDAFFSEMLTTPSLAAEFINGMMPQELMKNPEVIKAMKESELPDPNGLDKDGPWPGTISKTPSAEMVRKQEDDLSGLNSPRTRDNKLLPWAHRHPTDSELTGMTRAQLLDVMRRKSMDWQFPA